MGFIARSLSLEQHELVLSTTGRGFNDITHEVNHLIGQTDVDIGVCNIFILHTSASLIVTENADPSVKVDLEMIISRLAPDADAAFTHILEGDDDMSAHVRNMLTETSLTIPVNNNQLLLGTWQSVYLWEHRYQAQSRKVVVTIY